MAAKKTPRPATRSTERRTPRKKKAGTSGLTPAEATLGEAPAALQARIVEAGGVVVGAYRDPIGGHPLVLAMLPIDKIEPTPFQRDLSDTHHKRLAEVITKTGRFLDPVIAITAPPSRSSPNSTPNSTPNSKGEGGSGFWTPNGRHRLEAMRRLGARAITALVVADREVAWQILALNTEKAHNLKERALEVVRIYRGLLEEDDTRAESGFAFYLEDAALVTLGVCYEHDPRFAGGAYHPVLRRTERFTDQPIGHAIAAHEANAALTLDVEKKVAAVVARLRERGLTSPYLRSFVVARINPLRWIKGDAPPTTEVLTTMRDRASRFAVEKVRQEDVARMGGGVVPDEG